MYLDRISSYPFTRITSSHCSTKACRYFSLDTTSYISCFFIKIVTVMLYLKFFQCLTFLFHPFIFSVYYSWSGINLFNCFLFTSIILIFCRYFIRSNIFNCHPQFFILLSYVVFFFSFINLILCI